MITKQEFDKLKRDRLSLTADTQALEEKFDEKLDDADGKIASIIISTGNPLAAEAFVEKAKQNGWVNTLIEESTVIGTDRKTYQINVRLD